MKLTRAFVLAVVLALAPISGAFAFDGQLYLGKYFGQDTPSAPSSMVQAQFVSGVEIGHRLFNVFRPHVEVQTLMDRAFAEDNNAAFHPASVKYDLSLTVDLPKGIFAEISHMCWHPVDNTSKIVNVEQYNLVKIGINF